MKRLLNILITAAGLYVFIFMHSCGYGYIEPVNVMIPDTVSFSNDIVPIFEESCNESGCHSPGGVAPDLTPGNAHFDLWLYGMIDTANPEMSLLYTRMASSSNPMPPTGKLREDKIQLIFAWIEQGAQNN